MSGAAARRVPDSSRAKPPKGVQPRKNGQDHSEVLPREHYILANDRKTKRAILANAITELKCAKVFDVLEWNEFSLQVEVKGPLPWDRAIGPWSDYDDYMAAEWVQR